MVGDSKKTPKGNKFGRNRSFLNPDDIEVEAEAGAKADQYFSR